MKTKRRAALLVVALLVAMLVVGTGAAWAANVIECRVRPCEGTEGNDDIRGSEGDDLIYAKGGDDVVRGLGDSDRLIVGGDGDDRVIGGEGSDGLMGGTGRDVVIGGAKGDSISLREVDEIGSVLPDAPVSPDRAFGGANSDSISSNDGQRDFVDCGPNPAGNGDRVTFDQELDEVVNCEVVRN